MNGLGVETHLIYRGDKLLKNFDQPTAQFAAKEMQKKASTFTILPNITKIDRQSDGSVGCSLDNGQSTSGRPGDVCHGQTLTNQRFRHVKSGADDSKEINATIETNEQFQTSIPSIYALGDVVEHRG